MAPEEEVQVDDTTVVENALKQVSFYPILTLINKQATTAQVEGAEKEILVDDINIEIGEGEEEDEDNFEHLKEDGGNYQEGVNTGKKSPRSRNAQI